jgi:hypothetical protein
VNTERLIESPSFEIRREEAYRLLGLHRGNRPPKPFVLECFEEELERAGELVEARAVSRTFLTGVEGSDFLAPDLPVALAVCTIGPALEERVRELTAEGDQARAVILDAIGSAAAEGVADRCNLRICREALRENLRPDRRCSPGYGHWALPEQRWLFGLLGPDEIGVSLGESCMMTPRKSVSIAVPLIGGDAASRTERRCIRCGLETCQYRET